MPANTVSFDVDVTFPTPTTGNFTLSQNGQAVSGDITVTHSETVVYTLINSAGVIFDLPEVTNDPANNISSVVSEDGRVLSISDTDRNQETICIKLVVTNPANGAKVVSPDPQYRNIPF